MWNGSQVKSGKPKRWWGNQTKGSGPAFEGVRSNVNVDGQNRVSSMFGFLVYHAVQAIVTQLYFRFLIVRIPPPWSESLSLWEVDLRESPVNDDGRNKRLYTCIEYVQRYVCLVSWCIMLSVTQLYFRFLVVRIQPSWSSPLALREVDRIENSRKPNRWRWDETKGSALALSTYRDTSVECNHDIPTSLVYNENPWFQLAIIPGLSRPVGGGGAGVLAWRSETPDTLIR